jgi:hypothetical protein
LRTTAGRPLLGLVAGLTAFLLAAPASASFSISSKTLLPEFRAANSAYTVECSKPVRLRVQSGKERAARIGGRSAFRGVRSPLLELDPSQAVVVRRGERRYTVRCLPEDFPEYSYKRKRRGTGGLFAVTPLGFGSLDPNYVAIFNDFGAPVWWLPAPERAIDAHALEDGKIAFSTYFGGGYGQDERQGYRVVRPDGKLVAELRAVDALTDHHDLVETRDGNYLILAYVPRGPVDVRPFKPYASATVLDSTIQKLSPSGRLLWEWNSRDHIRLAESARWWPRLTDPYDATHINSVEELGGGDLLISLRHTDAVYRIDGRTGAVIWKLGGTPTSASLDTALDPNEPLFGGQHDARQLADGSITVFDNGTDLNRPPRAVRYRIANGTARLIAEVREPLIPESSCCGSARRLPGAWLVSWGGTSLIGGYRPDGARTFTLDFPGLFSYRATPIETIGEGALIEGMNERHTPLR